MIVGRNNSYVLEESIADRKNKSYVFVKSVCRRKDLTEWENKKKKRNKVKYSGKKGDYGN